jgi:hypothetical protein
MERIKHISADGLDYSAQSDLEVNQVSLVTSP